MKVYFYYKEDRDRFIEFIQKKFLMKLPYLVKEINLIERTFKEKQDELNINDREKYEGEFKELNLPDYYYGTLQDYFDQINVILNEEHRDILNEFFNGKITKNTSWIYYPALNLQEYRDYGRYTLNGEPLKKKYPIFIPSKGRWDKCYTAQYLDAVGAEFRIIVEEQEYEKYLKYYKEEQLLILPKEYQENYNTLDDLGLSKPVGPGAARNFAWDTAIKEGYDWHWVIDDNVLWFAFYNDNKVTFCDESGFALAEKLITSYDNVAMGAMNYFKFILRKRKEYPFTMNTRMYSIILIKNDIPFRWEGRYNEDTIISMRVLEKGYSTIQTNFVTAEKMTTQKMGGGNSDIFYLKEGTLPKSYMLCKEFPDEAELKRIYGRWHHYVNYKKLYGDNKLGKLIGEPYETKPTLEENFNGKLEKISDVCKVFGGTCHHYPKEKKEVLKKEGDYKKYIFKEPENVALITGFITKNTYNEYLKIKDKFVEALEEYDTIITCAADGVETLVGFYGFEYGKNMIDIEENELDKYIEKYNPDIVVIGENVRNLKVDKFVSLKRNSFLDF